MKNYSIKQFLTRHIIAWSLLMTAIPALWVYRDTAHEVEELFDASLAQSARVLHGLLNRESLANSQSHLIASLISKDKPQKAGHDYEKKVSFQIIDGENIVLKSASAPQRALSELVHGYHYYLVDEKEWRTFTHYSEEDKWWILIAEDMEIRDELTMDIARDHIVPMLLFIPLLIFMVSLTIRRGLQPLSDAAGQVEQQDFTQLKELSISKEPVEVRSLVAAINDLFQRLNDSYERERRFTSDAAHELRTPLASLQIHTENIIEENQDIALEPSIINMKRGIGKLTHLLTQLLSLSRAEAQQLEQSFTATKLNSTLNSAYIESQQGAQQKSQNLVFKNSDTVFSIQGNSALLQVMFSNIIGNAIKYSPEHSDIQISLNDTGLLTITDSGPGIPNELLERVKDRFFRVVQSKQEGSGLGLAIVDRVAELHHINWKMSNPPAGGLCVEFQFKATN